MFVPFNVDNDKYKKGDIVVNRKEITISYGTFTIGHEFTIIDKNKKYGGYNIIDNEHGIIVKRVNHTEISHKVNYKEAKIIRDNRYNRIKFKEFILKNCPHKKQEIDDRDYYDACNLKEDYRYRYSPCKCQLDCIKYIDNDKIKNDKFISTYTRRLKIKKLIKND